MADNIGKEIVKVYKRKFTEFAAKIGNFAISASRRGDYSDDVINETLQNIQDCTNNEGQILVDEVLDDVNNYYDIREEDLFLTSRTIETNLRRLMKQRIDLQFFNAFIGNDLDTDDPIEFFLTTMRDKLYQEIDDMVVLT